MTIRLSFWLFYKCIGDEEYGMIMYNKRCTWEFDWARVYYEWECVESKTRVL